MKFVLSLLSAIGMAIGYSCYGVMGIVIFSLLDPFFWWGVLLILNESQPKNKSVQIDPSFVLGQGSSWRTKGPFSLTDEEREEIALKVKAIKAARAI